MHRHFLLAGWALPLLALIQELHPVGAAGTFGPATTYLVGQQPNALVLADVNGDGQFDIITANEARTRPLSGGGDNYAMGIGALLPRLARRSKAQDVGSVSVLLGQPGGRFAAAQHYPVGRDPASVAVADLTGDGHADILTADADFAHGYTYTVLAGQPGGGFAAPLTYASSFLRTPDNLVLADLTGDGQPEVISVNELPNPGGVSAGDAVQVLPTLGGPAGGFGPSILYPLGYYSPRSLAVADLTGDGRPDAVVTNGQGYSLDSTVLVLPGLANGQFAPPLKYPGERGPTALADLNADGQLDLVAVSAHASSVRLGSRHGLGSPTRYAGTGEVPLLAVLADVNGDGHPDLLTNHYSYQSGTLGRVAVRLGLAAGGWGPPTTYAVGTNSAERFAVGDVSGEGHLDLVTLNRNTNTVSVLLGH